MKAWGWTPLLLPVLTCMLDTHFKVGNNNMYFAIFDKTAGGIREPFKNVLADFAR